MITMMAEEEFHALLRSVDTSAVVHEQHVEC
jgi:hypothetical protein